MCWQQQICCCYHKLNLNQSSIFALIKLDWRAEDSAIEEPYSKSIMFVTQRTYFKFIYSNMLWTSIIAGKLKSHMSCYRLCLIVRLLPHLLWVPCMNVVFSADWSHQSSILKTVRRSPSIIHLVRDLGIGLNRL